MVILLSVGSPASAQEKSVSVGNKNFTEQYIIGQMIKQLLEAGGFAVEYRPDLTSMALRAGMKSGEIDICADYTGTAWMIHLKRKYEPGTGHRTVYQNVKKADKENGFIWIDPIWNNNSYALASWPEFTEKHGLKTLSDLAALYRKNDGEILTFINFEFSARPDGLYALEDIYDFNIARSHLKTATPGASLLSLEEHKAKVAMVFGTDPAIAENGWHVYLDNKSVFPPYDLTPYIRREALESYPEIEEILNSLSASFPGKPGEPITPQLVEECQKIWRRLNAKVDVRKLDPGKVARQYLRENRLIRKD